LVRKIYQSEDSRSEAKAYLADRRKNYIDILKEKAKAQQLKPLERATARFATVYAAGCLAIKYGIFTWSRNDLLKAVLSCQLDALFRLLGRELIQYQLEKQLTIISLKMTQFMN
jgi:hypothetical protein